MKNSIFTRIHNYCLCKRYPFLELRNVWTDKPCHDHYDYTWLDDIDEGWRKIIARPLCKELRKQLKKEKWLKGFHFSQIKEKYGTLRLYCVGASSKVLEILHKYEDISGDYCRICGKPGHIRNDGWLDTLCDECYTKNTK